MDSTLRFIYTCCWAYTVIPQDQRTFSATYVSTIACRTAIS
jgi:hypothetical protein